MRLFNGTSDKEGEDIFILTLFVLSPLLARSYAYIMGEAVSGMSLFLFRGAASDIAVGLFVGGIVCVLPIRRNYFKMALWAIWAVMLSLDAAHVLVNRSHASIRFISLALDSTFIGGSVFALGNAVIIAVVMSTSALLAYMARRARLGLRPARALALSAVLAVICVIIPLDLRGPEWVQTSVLEANIRQLSGTSFHVIEGEMPERLAKRFRSIDISGTPIFKYPESQQNVLLFIMEGISYGAIESGDLPLLDALAKNNVLYPFFINSQKQTNRGLFALMCGDYPNFTTQEAKSDFYGTYGTPSPCLPENLARNGYHTVFMQGAPLGYMGKGLFSKAAGFREALGNQEFSNPLGRNQWGIDDLSLAREVFSKARALSEEGKPWFITALTSGTHHPYNVPGKKLPTSADAVAHLDSAVSELVSRLGSSGLLKNTLVLITSDEASISSSGVPYMPLIALVPQMDVSYEHPGIFAQVDMQLSINDYLALPLESLMGRSLFRLYDTGREVIFGNNYLNHIYILNSATSSLAMCSTVSLECLDRKSDSLLDSSSPLIKDLLDFVNYSDMTSDKLGSLPVLKLVETTYSGTRMILGDHKVHLSKGEELSFELELTAEAHVDVRVAIYGEKVLLNKSYAVDKGKPLEVAFSHIADKDSPKVISGMTVKTVPSTSYTIRKLVIRKK
jgi:hypothetical protein